MTADTPTYQDPSISLSLSNNSTSIEYGKSVTVSATITTTPGRFLGGYYTADPSKASNTGITWNALALETTNDTFNSKTTGITSGTSFTVSTKSTYYAVASGGTIKGKASAPSGYNQSTPITYAKNSLGQETTVYIPGDTSKKSSAEASTSISAGYIPYAYTLAASLPAANSTLPSTRSKAAPSSITVTGGNDSTYLYIFVPTGKSLVSLAAGPLAVPFKEVASSRSYVVNNSKATTFKVYQTIATVKAETFTATYS
jgi:hypothetical protein